MGHSMCYCDKCKRFVFYDDNWNIKANTCEDCTPYVEQNEYNKTDNNDDEI